MKKRCTVSYRRSASAKIVATNHELCAPKAEKDSMTVKDAGGGDGRSNGERRRRRRRREDQETMTRMPHGWSARGMQISGGVDVFASTSKLNRGTRKRVSPMVSVKYLVRERGMATPRTPTASISSTYSTTKLLLRRHSRYCHRLRRHRRYRHRLLHPIGALPPPTNRCLSRRRDTRYAR